MPPLARLKARDLASSREKVKEKAKVIKSHLSIEQRRQKLSELKKNSKCLRDVVGKGHWGQVILNVSFLGGRNPKVRVTPKGTPSQLLIMDGATVVQDDGMVIPPSAASSSKPVANMAVRSGARPKSVPKAVAKSRVRDESIGP